MSMLNRTATLVDSNGRELAHLEIDKQEPGLVMGNIAPTDDFAGIKNVFDEFEEAVGGFCLSHVDILDKQIRAMNIRLRWDGDSTLVPIDDLQIYPSEGVFSCRPRVPAEVNGTGHATKVSAT